VTSTFRGTSAPAVVCARGVFSAFGAACFFGAASTFGGTSGFGRTSASGSDSGTIAATNSFGLKLGDAAVAGAGEPEPERSTCSGSDDSGGATTSSVGGKGTGTSDTRSSGSSNRRSCQKNPKLGRPRPWPMTVRPNNTAWTKSESDSAYASRSRCARPWSAKARRTGPPGFGSGDSVNAL